MMNSEYLVVLIESPSEESIRISLNDAYNRSNSFMNDIGHEMTNCDLQVIDVYGKEFVISKFSGLPIKSSKSPSKRKIGMS